jgi:hypothetical protein
MKLNKLTWLLVITNIIIYCLVINGILFYSPNIPQIFIAIIFISGLNGLLATYSNSCFISKTNHLLTWFYCVLVNIVSLVVTYAIYIIRSGTIIKYPGDLAINVIVASFIIAVVSASIVFWISFFIRNKFKRIN